MYAAVKTLHGFKVVNERGFQCASFAFDRARSAELAAKDYATWKNRSDETYCSADEKDKSAGGAQAIATAYQG